MIVKDVLAILLAMLVESVLSNGPAISDSCDWIGSGSPQIVRGIQPVYLRCLQGTIQWYYPEGALRVVLLQGRAGSNFKACFKMITGSAGARMYLAGRKKLHAVFKNSTATDLVKCLRSSDGHLALYVEADPTDNPLRKRIAKFSYHLKRVPTTEREEDECRPCNEEELLQRFCTSDFVLRGTVSDLIHNQRLRRSEVTVKVTKVYQDSSPSLFQTNLPESFRYVSDQAKYATLHRPLVCGTKPGSGEYLFFGVWTLGNPTLTCIPRVGEWKRVRRRALKMKTNQCQIDF